VRQAATVSAAIVFGLAIFFDLAVAQILTPTPSEWMDKLDREHKQLVSPSGHVHARGRSRLSIGAPVRLRSPS
jgi:hypothetical protein